MYSPPPDNLKLYIGYLIEMVPRLRETPFILDMRSSYVAQQDCPEWLKRLLPTIGFV